MFPWRPGMSYTDGIASSKFALPERLPSSYESLSHAKWDGKYHVIFIPKGRKKVLYGKMRKLLDPVLRELAGQRGSTILEGQMVQDHVHMPPVST